VDTSPCSDNHADPAVELDQDTPAVPARFDLRRAIQRDVNSSPDVIVSSHTHADRIGSAATRGTVHQASGGLATAGSARAELPASALADAGAVGRLLADACNACRREGVAATRRELFARIAKRVGLSKAEVARRLAGYRVPDIVAAASADIGTPYRRDPVLRLATTILGAREREVFLARRDARPDGIAALQQLASHLEISIERIYQLEASARRKLAKALG
jgi:hypothetical protein